VGKSQAHGRAHAENAIRAFYRSLYDVLAPIHYGSFVSEVSARIHAAHQDRSLLGRWTPAHLLHAIECAAFASQRPEGFVADEHVIQCVMSLYREFTNPVQTYFLVELQSVDLWLMLLDREQLQTQFNATRLSVGRALRLLWLDQPLPRTSALIAHHVGFSVEDLLVTAFFGWAATFKRRYPEMGMDYGLQIPHALIPPPIFYRCMRELSYTPDELAGRHSVTRDMATPLRASSVESPFLRRPAIQLPGDFVIPRPDLMITAAISAVLELGERHCPQELAAELGQSLEKYLHTVMARAPGLLQKVDERVIRERASKRSCDGIFEFADIVLVVESKAVQLNAQLIDPPVLRDPACTTAHLAEGSQQVRATARDIRAGVYDDLLLDSKKPIFGVVLTLGHFPQANGEWMQNQVIRPRIPLNDRDRWPVPLEWEPQVWDVESLDRFVTILAMNEVRAGEIFERKREDVKRTFGEWDRFLERLTGGRADPLRDFFRAPFDEFWQVRFGPVVGPSRDDDT